MVANQGDDDREMSEMTSALIDTGNQDLTYSE